MVHSPGELFVAVAPLTLKIQVNLADEGEPSRWAKPTMMKLAAGEVRWITADNMIITNVGETNARFVWVGWFTRPK